MINNLYSDKVMDHFLHPRNMGELPDANGVSTVGNKVCVLPGTLILTNSGVTQIKDIVDGQKVLGHDGYYHQVIKIHKIDYSGKLCLIRTHNLGEIFITPEHHILALEASSFSHKFEAFKRGKILLDWLDASQLEKGDILLYPIVKETSDTISLDIGVSKLKWDFRSKDIPKKISIDDDFLRLAGYFMAEGYLGTGVCRKVLGFAFSSKEEEFIQDVVFLMKKFFVFSPSDIKISHNSANIIYYSSQLVQFFLNTFDKGAASKHLPHWMMVLPSEKQKAILCGLWRGDGYISRRQKTSKFVTISEQLAFQTRTLLLRQKMIFSFLITQEKGIHKKHYSFYIKEDKSLKKLAEIVGTKIDFLANKKSPKKTWFDDDFYYSTIWKVNQVNYEGPVYNLEVESSASYVTESATVHNCGDVMKIYLKVRTKEGQEIIEDVKFQTLGCGAAISTSSMATEMIKGKPLEEALKLTNKAVAEALGGLPASKYHCSVLAEQAVHKAVDNYLENKTKNVSETSK